MQFGLGRNKIEHSILDKKIKLMKMNLGKFSKGPSSKRTSRWTHTGPQNKKSYSGLVRKSREFRASKKVPKKEIVKPEDPEITKIKEFFKSSNLEHLTQTFLNNGFDEMDIILEVESDHLVDMEVGPEDQQVLFDAILTHKMQEEKFSSILDRVSKSRLNSAKNVEKGKQLIGEDDFETNDTLRFTEQLNITQTDEDTLKGSMDSGLVLTAPDKLDESSGHHNSSIMNKTYEKSFRIRKSSISNKGSSSKLSSVRSSRSRISNSRSIRQSNKSNIENVHIPKSDYGNEKNSDGLYLTGTRAIHRRVKPQNYLQPNKEDSFNENSESTNKRTEKGLQTLNSALIQQNKEDFVTSSCWNCYKQFLLPKNEHQPGKKTYCSDRCFKADNSIIKCHKCHKSVSINEALKFEKFYYCSKACQPDLKNLASELKKFVEENDMQDEQAEVIVQLFEAQNEIKNMTMGLTPQKDSLANIYMENDLKQTPVYENGLKEEKIQGIEKFKAGQEDEMESNQTEKGHSRRSSILKRPDSARSLNKKVQFDKKTVFDRPPSVKKLRKSQRKKQKEQELNKILDIEANKNRKPSGQFLQINQVKIENFPKTSSEVIEQKIKNVQFSPRKDLKNGKRRPDSIEEFKKQGKTMRELVAEKMKLIQQADSRRLKNKKNVGKHKKVQKERKQRISRNSRNTSNAHIEPQARHSNPHETDDLEESAEFFNTKNTKTSHPVQVNTTQNFNPYQAEESQTLEMSLTTPVLQRKKYMPSYGSKYSGPNNQHPKKKYQYLQYLRNKSNKNNAKNSQKDKEKVQAPVNESLDLGEGLQVNGWMLTPEQVKLDDNNLAGEGIGNYGRYDIGIGGGGGWDDAPEGERKIRRKIVSESDEEQFIDIQALVCYS